MLKYQWVLTRWTKGKGTLGTSTNKGPKVVCLINYMHVSVASIRLQRDAS